MLDYRINTFLCLCESMNFTIAGEKLNLTQPAVSQHIKYLEEKYNCILFNRSNKQICLTAQGQLLYNAMKTIQKDDNKIKSLLENSSTKKSKISFGLTRTIGEYLIFHKLIKYIKEKENTDFFIYYKNTEELFDLLAKGKIDFAIIEGFIKQNNYDTKHFRSDKYIALSSSKHIFKNKVKKISDLLSERLIIREDGSGTLNMLKNILSIENIFIEDFQNIIQVDNMHAIVDLLKNDCGISFLYKSAVEKEIKEGDLVEIKLENFNYSHDFNFIWDKNSLFGEEYISSFEEIMQLV